MKGVIRIGGAGLVGILFVLGALYVTNTVAKEATAEPGEIRVEAVSEKTGSVAKDTNGDGIPDWEELLQEKAFETVTTPASTSSATSSTYTPPTTFTGKFSEAFLQDYLEAKMAGEDLTDPAAFIENAVEAIEASTESVKHTRAELLITTATAENMRTYGNELVTIMNRNSVHTEHELVLFERALKDNDEAALQELSTIADGYRKIIEGTLRMTVPDVLALQHVDLLNAYEAVLLDIEAMQLVFDDPLYSLARLGSYSADIAYMSETLKSFTATFDAYRVTFTQEEPGSFFYIFDAL